MYISSHTHGSGDESMTKESLLKYSHHIINSNTTDYIVICQYF